MVYFMMIIFYIWAIVFLSLCPMDFLELKILKQVITKPYFNFSGSSPDIICYYN